MSICANCGQPAHYSPDDVVWLHDVPYAWGSHRWGDPDWHNGYYCDPSLTRFASNYRTRIDRDEFGGRPVTA